MLVSDKTLVKNGGFAHRLVVNSGCANTNTITGQQGLEKETDRLFIPRGDKLECKVLVMFTSVIGVNLDIGNVIQGTRFCVPNFLSETSQPFGADFSSWERFTEAYIYYFSRRVADPESNGVR